MYRIGIVASCAVLFLSLLLEPLPSQAQYTDRLGGSWSSPASAMITDIVLDRLARRRLGQKLGAVGAKDTGAASTPSASPTAAVSEAVRFRSMGTPLKTREIANQLGGSAQEKEEMSKKLGKVLELYEKEAVRLGRSNDLSLAYSFFFVTNAAVYHDMDEPPDSQLLELRDRIANALVEDGKVRTLDDRRKQEIYEVLVLYTGLAVGGYQQAKQDGDTDTLKAARELAGSNLETLSGISPDKINLTANGLTFDRGLQNDPKSAFAATETAKPPIVYSEIMKAYDTNELGAEAKYGGGRRIVVSARVNAVSVVNDRIRVYFVTPFVRTTTMLAYFPMSQKDALASVQHDQVILVEGTVRGSEYSGVVMEDCILK